MTYEAHITLDPIDGLVLDRVRNYARAVGFSVGDEPIYSERLSRQQAFMTGHNNDFDKMQQHIVELVIQMKSEGCKINRYKIERIVLDSRQGDRLGLLA